MIHYIETHGVEFIVAYMAFASLVSSMPPIPDSAGYLSRWVYGFLHLAASNLRGAMAVMKLDVPAIDPNSVTTNTVITTKKTINTTDKPVEVPKNETPTP